MSAGVAQRGAATLELIIGCLAAIPLFFGISLLGKYADMQHKTVESTRYVIWENVIWPGGREKDASKLEYETTDRFLGHRKAPVVDHQIIVNQGTTEEFLWRDHRTRTLMVADGSTVRVDVAKRRSEPVRHNRLVAGGAYAGIRGKELGLTRAELSHYQVSMPITDRIRNPVKQKPSTLIGFFDPASYEKEKTLNLTATGAILSDTWISASDAEFKRRTEGLVINDEVEAAVYPGTHTFGAFPLFKEGRYGRDVDVIPDSHQILSEYIQ